MTVDSRLLLREKFRRDILLDNPYLNDEDYPFTLPYLDKWVSLKFLLSIPHVPVVQLDQVLSIPQNSDLPRALFSTFNIPINTYYYVLKPMNGRHTEYRSYWYSKDIPGEALALCFVFLPSCRTTNGNLLYALAKCIRSYISVEVREAETIQLANRDATDLFISDHMEPTRAILLAGRPFPFVQTTPSTIHGV